MYCTDVLVIPWCFIQTSRKFDPPTSSKGLMSRPRRLDGLTFSKDVWYRITVVYNFCLFDLAVWSYTFRQGEVKEGSVVAWAGHATYGSYLGSVTVCYGTVLAV